MVDLLVGKHWLFVDVGTCELEDIVGPVSGVSGLMDWRGVIVNAAASECQETLGCKHLGVAKVYGALDETGPKDMVVDNVAKFLGQTKEAALSLLVDL